MGTLLVFYPSTYAVHGYRFPVGPDAPVYIWWARLAGHEGLSAIPGLRPGVPALTLVVGGALGLGPVAAVAALEIALALATALAAVALTVDRGRKTWVATGAFTGLWAVHLALGYVATLAAATFLVAAAAAVTHRSRSAVIAAALLLGAAGLSHPQFFAIGVAILLATAIVARVQGHGSEPVRIVKAVTGGLAITGVGLAAMLPGPPALDVDMSRDDVLERLGMLPTLRGLFRARLLERLWLYAPIVTVPLAIVGGRAASGFCGRLLRAWGLVLVATGVAAYATGLFPPERLVTFGFVIPIATALGVVVLWHRARGKVRPLVAALAVAFALPAVLAWEQTPPKIWPLQVERTTEAGRYASASPPGTRLVFIANGRQPIASFFATEAANAIRAAVPPDRIRDVRVVVTELAAQSEENRRVAEMLGEQAEAGLTPEQPVLRFDLGPFDRMSFGETPGARFVADGVAIIGDHPQPAPAPVDPLEPSSPAGIAAATLGVLALLAASGFGWARWALASGLPAIALAPAFGAATLMLAGLAIDRMGMRLDGWIGPALAVGVVGLSGYLAVRRVAGSGSGGTRP